MFDAVAPSTGGASLWLIFGEYTNRFFRSPECELHVLSPRL